MPASLWKSLTVRFTAPGHPLHEAECIAAAIGTGCLVIATMMGYRPGDAERERSPAFVSWPETRSITMAGHCGTVPERVDRDGMLLQCQLDPARPASRGEPDGIPGERRISSAVAGPAATVCW